jgi:hypothetical protein
MPTRRRLRSEQSKDDQVADVLRAFCLAPRLTCRCENGEMSAQMACAVRSGVAYVHFRISLARHRRRSRTRRSRCLNRQPDRERWAGNAASTVFSDGAVSSLHFGRQVVGDGHGSVVVFFAVARRRLSSVASSSRTHLPNRMGRDGTERSRHGPTRRRSCPFRSVLPRTCRLWDSRRGGQKVRPPSSLSLQRRCHVGGRARGATLRVFDSSSSRCRRSSSASAAFVVRAAASSLPDFAEDVRPTWRTVTSMPTPPPTPTPTP